MNPIAIVPYDPQWAIDFQALRQVYEAALHRMMVSVEHVGSTAVPGLEAKPILDVDLVIPTPDELSETVSRLAVLGYRHQGDLDIAGREAFSRDGVKDVPRDGSGRLWPAHHLYVCAADSEELRRHLAFRDALNASPRLAEEYAALKRGLAEQFPHDRDAYSAGKSAYITRILQRSDVERETGGPGQR